MKRKPPIIAGYNKRYYTQLLYIYLQKNKLIGGGRVYGHNSSYWLRGYYKPEHWHYIQKYIKIINNLKKETV
jgi:hypothetical protein